MATTTSLQFKITSAYDGGAVDRARESIAALNRDLESLSNQSVKVTVNVDSSALTRLRQDLDNFGRIRATAQANVNANTGGLDAARASLDRFGAMRVTAHADVDTDRAHAGLIRLVTDSDDSSNHLRLLTGSAGGASGGINGIGGAASGASGGIGTMGTAAQAGGASLGGLGMAAGAVAIAIAAIGPIAALTSAAVLGALGTAFVGVGALALSQTAVVKNAFTGLKNSVMADALQAAQGMKGPLLAGISELETGLHKLVPAFSQAFSASGQLIKPLVESLLGFTRAVMPGVIAALRAAGPVFDGLRVGMTALGKGMSTMFAGMAAGAKGAGAALQVVLSGIGKMLGIVGQAFGQMAASGAKSLAGLMSGLVSITKGAMAGFVGAVKAMGNSLGPFLAALGRVVGVLLQTLLPVFGRVLGTILQGLTPALLMLANTFQKVMVALMPLLPPLTKIMTAGLTLLVALLRPLMPLLVLMAQLLGKLAPVINIVAIGINAMSKAIQAAITWLSSWKNITTAFSTAWNATWNALKTATLAIWAALGVAWRATLSGLATAWNATSAALKVAWNAVWNAMLVAGKAIWVAMQAAWNAVCVAFRTLWQAVATALQASWNALWTAMKAVGQAAWTAMQAAWNAMCTAFRTIMTAFATAMNAAWNLLWNTFKTVGQAAWNALSAAWKAFTAAFEVVMTAFRNAMVAAWNLLWNTFKNVANAAWGVLKAGFNAFRSAIEAAMTAFRNAMVAAWNLLWNTMKNIANAAWSALKAGFNAFSSAFKTATNALMSALKTAWSAGAKAIGAAWAAIKKLVRDPIQAVVNVVYNNGIVKLWNVVAGVFGAPKLSAFTLPNFATGGPVQGPGGPTDDRVVARLSAGEHVWTAAEVEAAGGHDQMLAMRANIMGGNYKPSSNGDGYGGFALGGIIPDPGDILGDIAGFFKKAFKVVGGVASAAFNIATGFGGDIIKHLADLAMGEIAPIVNPLIQKAANVGKDTVKGIIPGSPWIEQLIAGGGKPGVVSTGGSNPQDVPANAQGALGGDNKNVGTGGIIQTMADYIMQWISSHDIPVGGGNTAEAQKWADEQVGKPYSLGSFGSSFDCSSFMSGIAQIILGKKPSPLFTTFAFTGAKQGPATFERNLNAPFMVGVENRGVGHMAGTLNGKNYEATPPKVRSGPSARGAHDGMFDMVYGMKASIGGGQGVIPVGQHKAIIDAALAAAHVPPPGTLAQWEAGLNTLITRESAWNSSAINRTDSNAAAGHPSQGLAQVIPSTFAAYHVAGTSSNILDPIANVAAAIRYIVARYGNITNVQQANASLPPKGYANGTDRADKGWHMIDEEGGEWINFRGGEKVLPHGKHPTPAGEDHSGCVHVKVENHWHGNPTKEAVQHAEGSMAEKLRRACVAGVGGRNH